MRRFSIAKLGTDDELAAQMHESAHIKKLKFRRLIRTLASCMMVGGLFSQGWAQQATINGFVVEQTSVPLPHIVRAAPAKDSIASLDAPTFVTEAESGWLQEEDEVISVTIGTDTRAYPLRVLVWHEVVNDKFGEQFLAVTYSALTGSVVVFDPGKNTDGSTRSFGVSGLLYNSCLLMYDREKEELWSQLRMMGVSGTAMETALKPIASTRMKWSAWKKLHPAGMVLSKETGHEVDYTGEWPYGDYSEQAETIFPFDVNRNEFGTKERVIGVVEGESSRCWPLERLMKKKQLFDAVGPRPINVVYDEKTGAVTISDITNGEIIPAVSVFWFAWQAFYPDTSIWMPMR